jgi:hypothetical protein
MKEELGIDVTIQYNGDEPAWGTTDDDVNGKLWRCTFFIVQQADPKQIIEVGHFVSPYCSPHYSPVPHQPYIDPLRKVEIEMLTSIPPN